jgi:transcriptional regulator with XRE-family HTH domain/Tfp pilus assembly protein PilF
LDLGAKIRQLRKERGLSQEEVGRGVLTRSMISAIERGKARPSLKALEVIAQGLNKPVDYFLEDEATDRTYKRVRANLLTGEALIAEGRAERARELLEEVLPAAETLGYRATEIRLALGMAELSLGHPGAARKEFEACLLPEEGVLEEEIAEAHMRLGQSYLATGQPQEALAQLEKAWGHLRGVNLEIDCLYALAEAHLALGNPAGAVSRLEAAARLATPEGLSARASASLAQAQRQLDEGNYEAASRDAAFATHLRELAHLWQSAHRVRVDLARAMAQAGAEHEALRLLRLAFRRAQAEGDTLGAARVLTQMATIHRSLSRLNLARGEARRALELAAGDGQVAGTALHLLGVIASEQGDTRTAEAHLLEAARRLEEAGAPSQQRFEVLSLLSEVLRAAGRDREAYDTLSRAHALLVDRRSLLR